MEKSGVGRLTRSVSEYKRRKLGPGLICSLGMKENNVVGHGEVGRWEGDQEGFGVQVQERGAGADLKPGNRNFFVAKLRQKSGKKKNCCKKSPEDEKKNCCKTCVWN